MKFLMSKIDSQEYTVLKKYRLSRLAAALPAGACGFLCWLFISCFTLSTISAAVCFTGWPMVLAWTLAYIYGCNHPFHEGPYVSNAAVSGPVTAKSSSAYAATR